MPINIYSQEPDAPDRVAWLCDDNWRLPDQAEALEAWLVENHATFKPGRYVADIGFTPREGALGGAALAWGLNRNTVGLSSRWPPQQASGLGVLNTRNVHLGFH